MKPGFFRVAFLIVILPLASTRLMSAPFALHPTGSTSFVIDEAGVLYAWGRNDFGQTGNGTLSVEPPYVAQPTAIAPPQGASGWKRIAGAWAHTLGIADNDQLYAWGFNGSGRLGTGLATSETEPTPVVLPPGVSGWSDVAAGNGHSLAIGNDGNVYAWGANDWGQLGIGAPGAAGPDVPTMLNLPAEAGAWKAVAAGSAHTLALSQSGQLYFWGRNVVSPQEGADIVTARPPTWISPPAGATAWAKIGAGYNHSFAIANNGKLYAWGANRNGQLGNGATRSVETPQLVQDPDSGPVQWTSAVGGFDLSIGLDHEGNAYTWGRVYSGENGILTRTRPMRMPDVPCSAGWKSVAAGYSHFLAIAGDCRVYGWADNNFNQSAPSAAVMYQSSPVFVRRLKTVCLDVLNTPPSVNLSSFAEYLSPASIKLTAAFSDCEANVIAVTFYEGSNVLAIVETEMTNSSSAVSFTWTNVTEGTYTFHAAAVDQFGARATSSPITVLVMKLTNGITDIVLTTNQLELANVLLGWDCGGIVLQQASVAAVSLEGNTSIGIFGTSPPLFYGLAGPGVIMSTGNVGDYRSGPNRSIGTTFMYDVRATTKQEVLLDLIDSGTNNYRHYDVTELSIRFDVLPGYERVRFALVFGTEEYPEFVNSAFQDVFGILLNGTNIAYADGAPINQNHPSMLRIFGTELDGLLAPRGDPKIVITASVTPGSSDNELIFVLADTADAAVDTTVYLSELQAIRTDQELRMDIIPAHGLLTLRVSNIPCGQVAIEASADLLQWTVLSTNTSHMGLVQTAIPVGSSANFFRARRVR